MRREDDVVHLAQWMIGGQRLDVEHVEPGAGDLVLPQRRQQRRLLDDGTARGVDDVGRRLHQAELLCADEAARALRQDHVDGDEVRLAEQLLLAHVTDTGLLALLRRQVLAPGDDPHAERLRDLGRAGAELAEAENAEGQAFEIKADRGLPRHAGLHSRVLVADATGQLEHQADGDAGSRAAGRWRAADHDAALLGGADVDRGVAQAGGDEQLQIRQLLDHRAGKPRALAHGADDVEALQRLDDVVLAAQMLLEHLDVEVGGDFRPIGDFKRDVLVVVEDRAAMARHGEYPWLDGSSGAEGTAAECPYSTG